jgi:chemotaxis signal transduction protein
MRPLFATTAALAASQAQADERVLDILVIGLAHTRRGLQSFGLLTSQVHSIVRLDVHDERLRRTDAGGWELLYEGTWIPLRHLREALGLADPGAVMLPDGEDAVRILSLRLDPAAPDGASNRYVGLMVDEVIEIAAYSLLTIWPFPRWATRAFPAQAIWGAIAAEGGAILLLLDGLVLAGEYTERQEQG